MFLSKKTATFNKPKPQEGSKPKRMLGGWNDEEEERQPPTLQPSPTAKQSSVDLLADDPADLPPQLPSIPAAKQPPQCDYQDWDTLNERADIDIEKGLVEEIVKPSGIRIKQSDSALNEFFKEVKFLEASVIGSLLLSKLEVNYPFPFKAKALYAIEFLSKRSEDFLKYFRSHADKLRAFPEPEDNVENYRKIWRSLMNVLGERTGGAEEEKRQFVDPGYGLEEAPPKSAIGSFILENAGKSKKAEGGKALVGPGGHGGQGKPKKEENLLDFGESSLV